MNFTASPRLAVNLADSTMEVVTPASSDPEPVSFMIRFLSAEDETKARRPLRRIGSVHYTSKERTVIVNRSQLKLLDKLKVKYELLTTPPRKNA